MLVEDLEDVVADVGQLSLNLVPVCLDLGDLLGVVLRFLLLFDGGDDAPRSTAGTDDLNKQSCQGFCSFDAESITDILVGHGQQVTLLDRELDTQLGHTRFRTVRPLSDVSGTAFPLTLSWR